MTGHWKVGKERVYMEAVPASASLCKEARSVRTSYTVRADAASEAEGKLSKGQTQLSPSSVREEKWGAEATLQRCRCSLCHLLWHLLHFWL